MWGRLAFDAENTLLLSSLRLNYGNLPLRLPE
jgi:hypothetical protein